jgi:hypothetical protein
MHYGLRMGVDSVLRQRSKMYVNSTLFLEYINNIFVLYLNDLRETEEFETCEAVLLMDNCLNHMSHDVITIFTREQIIIVIFANHMTNIFQILDVVLFDVLKKHATGIETLDDESRAAAFLFKVYRNLNR